MVKFLTSSRKKYWQERKIDWNTSYLQTWNHPHRQLITWALQSFPWVSLWEVGCGPGANLVRITQELKGKQLGGSDISQDAIELARKTFVGGKFHVESVEDMLLSDKAVDVMLSDATLIYIDPSKIDAVVDEMFRVTRNRIVLCEFHSTSFIDRWLFRLKTGYNAYNWKELLEKHGAYDIQMQKISKDFWDGFPWSTYGHIIIAKLPQS